MRLAFGILSLLVVLWLVLQLTTAEIDSAASATATPGMASSAASGLSKRVGAELGRSIESSLPAGAERTESRERDDER
jgi:hypothetical protein